MVKEALVRLYDLPSSGSLIAADLPPAFAHRETEAAPVAGTTRPVITPSAGPRAESLVELRQDEAVLGRCVVNALGPGTVGACEVAAGVLPGLRPQVYWALVHLALERLQWLGYAYGLLEVGDFADRMPQAVEDAVWWVPPACDAKSPSARDVTGLEWGDLFLDLRTWAPRNTTTRLRVNGRELQVRRPEANEQLLLTEWIRDTFGGGWASEVHRSFSRDPISSVIVVDLDKKLPAKERLIGFIAYDTARLGMLSSIALVPAARGQDVFVALLLLEECLREAKASGMPYAVLGGVSRRLTALRGFDSLWTIPGSCPGVFGKGVRY